MTPPSLASEKPHLGPAPPHLVSATLRPRLGLVSASHRPRYASPRIASQSALPRPRLGLPSAPPCIASASPRPPKGGTAYNRLGLDSPRSRLGFASPPRPNLASHCLGLASNLLRPRVDAAKAPPFLAKYRLELASDSPRPQFGMASTSPKPRHTSTSPRIWPPFLFSRLGHASLPHRLRLASALYGHDHDLPSSCPASDSTRLASASPQQHLVRDVASPRPRLDSYRLGLGLGHVSQRHASNRLASASPWPRLGLARLASDSPQPRLVLAPECLGLA